MKPIDLDLNLDNMRADALKKMIASIRTALQECDDIEAMARVLHSRTATDIKIRAGAHRNGNQPETSQKLLGPRGRKKHSRHSDRDQIREAALTLIDKSGDQGIGSIDLEQRLRANSVFPASMTIQSARTSIRMALLQSVNEKRIHLSRHPSGPNYYYAGGGNGSASENRAPINFDVTETELPQGATRIDKLRHFIVSTLAVATEPIPVATMHEIAITQAGFSPKWGNGDTLRNQMGRVLREMLENGAVKRYGKGRAGPGGQKFTYTIVRPKVSVRKTD